MNLLRQNPWYLGADKVFAEFPWSYFVYTEQIPKNLSFFGRDVNQKFQELQTLEETMALEPDDKLAIAVHRLIRTYITRRTEDKSGINLEELPKNEKGFRIYPTSYRETLEKVCSDLFLGFRSRRDHDFVEYFTGTLGAYPQWLPEDDYLLITRVLLSDPDQIKTLSMLAVSAISYLPKPSQNNKED